MTEVKKVWISRLSGGKKEKVVVTGTERFDDCSSERRQGVRRVFCFGGMRSHMGISVYQSHDDTTTHRRLPGGSE